MPQKQKLRGGGAKKIGRMLVKCARYRANKTRERNKLRRLKKLPQCPFVARRIRELEDYIYGRTENDQGRKERHTRRS